MLLLLGVFSFFFFQTIALANEQVEGQNIYQEADTPLNRGCLFLCLISVTENHLTEKKINEQLKTSLCCFFRSSLIVFLGVNNHLLFNIKRFINSQTSQTRANNTLKYLNEIE